MSPKSVTNVIPRFTCTQVKMSFNIATNRSPCRIRLVEKAYWQKRRKEHDFFRANGSFCVRMIRVHDFVFGLGPQGRNSQVVSWMWPLVPASILRRAPCQWTWKAGDDLNPLINSRPRQTSATYIGNGLRLGHQLQRRIRPPALDRQNGEFPSLPDPKSSNGNVKL